MMRQTGRKELIGSCFRDCVGGDVLLLQCMGLYSMGNIFGDNEPRWYYWEVIPYSIGLAAVTFAVICDIRNVQHAAQISFMLSIEVAAASFTAILSVFKGYRIFFRRKELYHILKSCQRRWMLQTTRDAITQTAIENAKNARLLRMCYAVAIMGTLESYNLRPYILYLKFRVSETNDSFDFSQTVYPAYYPFILKSFTQYFVFTTLEHMSLYFFALWWISADCLFAQFNTYLAIQFNILATDIRCIDTTTESASPVNAVKIMKGLKKIIREHVKLFSYVHAVEDWYNPIIFATILMNGLSLCSLLYSLQYRIAEHNWKDAIKNASHVTAIIIQTLLYCSYAQRLSDEVNGFRQAVYGCSWINFNVPTKTLILLLMIYTEREYTFSAYGLFYLNMRQVTTIFSTAMRFFTILRNLT
ncbi:odorant receptor 10a-like isoform X2 [Diachasmimorpha longicaudata]|uniref:odorant receptor 10a-like isoform X2 n=1 Tax=Diachasmimorpha longicaudata TaxID=58733 RepID=UPI0030B88766